MKKEQSWIKHSRIFAFEAWWPPFWPHIDIDWDQVHETMERLDLDVLQANALTKWALYPTDLVKEHPELNGRDLVAEAREFCDKYGYKMILYSLFGHGMPISTQLGIETPGIARPMFPDMEIKNNPKHMRSVDESVVDLFSRFHFGDERYVAHCPFAMEEWLTKFTTEIAQRYEYEAAWLDGSLQLGWMNDEFNNVCTCHVCQKAYLDEFHKPMPIITDKNDPRLYELLDWNLKRLDVLLTKITGILKKDQDLPIVGNIAKLTPIVQRPELLDNLQGGLFEHSPDTIELIRKASRATSQIETAIIYPDCYDPWPRKVTAGWEVENKGLTLLSFDATPYLAQPGKYYFDDTMDEPAKRIFSFMKEHNDLLREQEEIPYCAVVTMSDIKDELAQEFQDKGVRGWVRALMDEHIQVVDIPEHFLRDYNMIQKYPVLVLESLSHINEDYIQTLFEYVEKGGSVYIGYDIGTYNCHMEKSNRVLLKELFDISTKEYTEEEIKRRDIFDGNYDEYEPTRTYDVYAAYDKVACDSVDFPMPLRYDPCFLPDVSVGDSYTLLAHSVATDDNTSLLPLFAYKSIGKGKVIYGATAMGIQYLERNDKNQSAFMKDIITFMAPPTGQLEVNGSRDVFVRTTQLEQGKMVYIVNNSSDRQEKQSGWLEMKKVNELPYGVGKVMLSVAGGSVEVLYGQKPDFVESKEGVAEITYENLNHHAILIIK